MRFFARNAPPPPVTVVGDRNSRSRGITEPRMTEHATIQNTPAAHSNLDGNDVAADDGRWTLPHTRAESADLVPQTPTTVIGDGNTSDKIMEMSSSTMPQPWRRVDEAVKSGLGPTPNLHHRENIQEMAALREKVTALEAELRFADGELRKVKGREQKLLDKILDKSQGEQFYDSDLIRSFRNIREEVQRLAKSPLYATSGSSRRPWVAERRESEAFFEEWHEVPRKERQLLIRWRMFEHLYRFIFSSNIFGVSASGMATQGEADMFRRIEANLSGFETIVQHRGVEEDAVTDWRVATLKCIRLGRLTQDPGADVAGRMYHHFERLTAEDLSDSDLEKLRRRILLLCQDAVKLKLLMRGSQEDYECLEVTRGSVLAEIGDWAEAYAVYNGNNTDMESKVHFTLFGALVKRPKYQGEEEVVLEKAQVVTSAQH